MDGQPTLSCARRRRISVSERVPEMFSEFEKMIARMPYPAIAPLPPEACHVCGAPGVRCRIEVEDLKNVRRSYCVLHAPPEILATLKFGPHRTAAEEVVTLKKMLARMGNDDDPAAATARANLEQLIEDVEAGRRRVGDAR